MSILKQFILCVFALALIFVGWLYFSPSAITTLSHYQLDYSLFRQVAAFGAPSQAAQKSAPQAKQGKQGQANRQNSGRRRGPRQALVIVQPVETGTINDKLSAIGNGKALHWVTITPLVSGQITQLPISSGARVKSGDIIAVLDDERETIALELAKLNEKELLDKANRTGELLKRNAVSAAQYGDAKIALVKSELAVREAQLALDRRIITSPIDGVAGIFKVSLGDYVTNQTQIVTIDDRSAIVVEYFVPERFAALISVGMPIEAYLVARPHEKLSGLVSAVDNRIDVASRTLRVQASIANENDSLREGMAFTVNMQFEGETYPAVNPLAIQWSSAGPYVWVINKDNIAKRQDVRIIQRNGETVLVSGALLPGQNVVVEGVQNVREGAGVKIVGQNKANNEMPQGRNASKPVNGEKSSENKP